MHKRKKATEGEKVLAAIYAIQLELRRAQAGFQDETDEALIDSYIYEIISLHKKYEYYLRGIRWEKAGDHLPYDVEDSTYLG